MATEKPALSRTSLLLMLLSLLLVNAPHTTHMPLWESVAVLLTLLWHLLIIFGYLGPPRRWLLVMLTVATGLGILLSYGTLIGRDAGVALLVAMSILKLIESRTHRDAMVLLFLAYFLVITNFLFTQSIPTVLYMLLVAWMITATMISVNEPPGAPLPLKRKLATGATLIAQAVPLMLVLFILVPRIPGPLWFLPDESREGLTGLSDSMTPGSISNLTRSGEVAFRVEFIDDPPPQDQLYWRGPVLTHFDGLRWTQAELFNIRQTGQNGMLGESIDYWLTLQPHGRRWMLALDIPARVPQGSFLGHEYQLVSHRSINEVKRWRLSAALDYWIDPQLRHTLRRANLRLPSEINPRTLELARRWRRELGTEEELGQIVERARRYFAEQEFSYTLSPPLLTSANRVDEFLFDSRQGYCEHYAGAFVALMRAAGIPARVVTGYQGGELNPVGNYLIVRQSEAHAWAEVWLEEGGWLRVDPTAWVSPSRVEQGVREALGEEASGALPLISRNDIPLLRQITLRWDALNNAWNLWVLGYGPEQQRAFLSRFGLGSWERMTIALVLVTAAVGFIVVGLTLWRQRRRFERDPIVGPYRRLCRRLAAAGLAKADSETPRAFAERVAESRPSIGESIATLTALYYRLRYGPDQPPRLANRYRRLARRFSVKQ